MKVSVVIPVYNEEEVIRACLRSLAKQSHRDFEIIVVDDGSTDSTFRKLQNSKTPKLQAFRQEHKGAGSARNLGAKRARGEILVFVDADMTFDKDFIRKLVNPILEKKVIGTFSKEEYLANKNNIWARCWNINRGFSPDQMHSINYPETQKVFRAILKEEFEKVRGFDEKVGYTDDWSLSEKLGVEAVSVTGAIFYHHNPETLKEVFIQSKWMAKRKYKFGVLGYLFALIRVSLPVSVVSGLLVSITYYLVPFVVFKIVSDFGQFIGILEYVLSGKVSK